MIRPLSSVLCLLFSVLIVSAVILSRSSPPDLSQPGWTLIESNVARMVLANANQRWVVVNNGHSSYGLMVVATATSLRSAVWTNALAWSPGRSINIWAEHSHPDEWPSLAPILAWDTNSLLYGHTGFTAVSECNSINGAGDADAQWTLVSVGAYRRFALFRGHGTAGNTGILCTNWCGLDARAWWCDATNGVHEAGLLAKISRGGASVGSLYDYTVGIFSNDLPATITPIRLCRFDDWSDHYVGIGTSPRIAVKPCQHRLVSLDNETEFPSWYHNSVIPGDSGSPDLLPVPDGAGGTELVMYDARSSHPTQYPEQLQADIFALAEFAGLATNTCEINWWTPTNYP